MDMRRALCRMASVLQEWKLITLSAVSMACGLALKEAFAAHYKGEEVFWTDAKGAVRGVDIHVGSLPPTPTRAPRQPPAQADMAPHQAAHGAAGGRARCCKYGGVAFIEMSGVQQ